VLRRLLPKKPEFFELFRRQAALALTGARALQTLIEDLPRAQEHATHIRKIEHEADAVCHEAIDLLHRSFITPIERGDIHLLASKLDDVVDHIEATGQRLWLYEIEKATPEVRETAALLVRATEGLQRVIDAFALRSDAQQIRVLCAAVKEVEKANDRLLRGATAKLFKEEDAKTLIKWQRIYDDIEEAIDACNAAANLVEGVVLENS
jgi:predicted phosphate transport protein (TIGR00153 family)